MMKGRLLLPTILLALASAALLSGSVAAHSTAVLSPRNVSFSVTPIRDQVTQECDIGFLGTTIELSETLKTVMTHEYFITNIGSSPLYSWNWSESGEAMEVRSSDLSGSLSYEVSFNEEEQLSLISTIFREPILTGNSVRFVTACTIMNPPGFNTVDDNRFVFSFMPAETRSVGLFSLVISVPSGMSLENMGSVNAISPSSHTNFTDGSNLLFGWQYEEVVPSTLVFFMRLESLTSASLSTNRDTTEMPDWVWVLIGAAIPVIIAIAGFAVTLYWMKRSDKARQPASATEKQSIESSSKYATANAADSNGQTRVITLTKHEKRVFNAVQANNGATQTEISKALKWGKSSLSQYLTSLEEKGLIRKTRDGRFNRIFIQDELITDFSTDEIS